MRNSNFKTSFFVLILSAGLIMPLLAGQPQARNFSLESVLSAPFPSDLVASPRGDVIAWAVDDQGKRNVFVAQAPDFKARPVTHFDTDDGQEISALAFNFDGSIIVFVRNQGMNRSGEYPNPTSNTQGAEQAVWAVKAAGGDPWKIGQGSGPVTSPAENIVVYTLRGKIFFSPLEGTPKPQSLFNARGTANSCAFSPDGLKLAFSSDRGDHSFIGVFDLKGKTILWVSPAADRDGFPAFSPDGAKLAFFRFPGASSEISVEDQSTAFSIMIADSAIGTAKEAWCSPNASGGFAQNYFPQPLTWVAGGKLVFYSEHEGWMHLYSLNPADGKVLCLTPGEFEVEDSCLSNERGAVIFNSNQGDIDRRHLWTVPIAGGAPKIITQGQGLEWRPKALAGGGLLAFLCSTSRRPAAPAVISVQGKGEHLIAPELIPADFPSKELVDPQQVVFKAPDGLEIHGQLFMPKSAKPGDRRPAAIFMHGGPIRQMLLGWHYMYYYHNTYAFNQYLASQGYVVLSVNYRLGIGYGRAFREAPKGGYRGASEYQDITAAGKYLQNRPEVDPNRIGLWGGSYGGYLTALGLARDSAMFAAGVDLHGVHDWSAYIRAYTGSLPRAKVEEYQRISFDASPVASVDFWASPVLFIHGDDDRNVEFSQTTDMVQRLRKQGRTHLELLIFPDEVHDFLRHANWLKAYHAASDFFDRMLKK
jgi:dipeptidyl aminopeptidase/acylaminoacyl peptidase